MSHQGGVSPWIAEVSSRFGVVTPAQARVLAYWSYGMVLSQSCGLTTVATFLATLLGTGYDAQRQQLREWCYYYNVTSLESPLATLRQRAISLLN